MAEGEVPGGRVHAFISGRVQGVGFRFFVQRAASEAGVTGWVRNRWDGQVEAVAEGEPGSLARFTAALRKGPPGSFVSAVDLEWGDKQGEFEAFEIRATV